jgi:hypothetical protein
LVDVNFNLAGFINTSNIGLRTPTGPGLVYPNYPINRKLFIFGNLSIELSPFFVVQNRIKIEEP